MLLTNLINQFTNQYADIQAQIEELQEQQRKIQAHLQQLGSVESQMVSAVQMLQEAISSVNEVCPDQLAEYKETITNLFSVPVAALEPSKNEPEPQPETNPSPNPEPTSSNVINFPANDNGNDQTSNPDNVISFPQPEPETTGEEPLFMFRISHGGDYLVYWRAWNDKEVVQLFKDLKIRPRDKKTTEGYNPFGGVDTVHLQAYLTSLAFGKIEDKAVYIDADKLD